MVSHMLWRTRCYTHRDEEERDEVYGGEGPAGSELEGGGEDGIPVLARGEGEDGEDGGGDGIEGRARRGGAELASEEKMGARPIKRIMQKNIENRLSEIILDQSAKEGDEVKFCFKKGEVVFEIKEA